MLQSEIVKRLSAIVGQVLPFLSQEHQQQVATAVERAKQVTMSELNSVIGVSLSHLRHDLSLALSLSLSLLLHVQCSESVLHCAYEKVGESCNASPRILL